MPIDFSHPTSLADTYSPMATEQARQSSLSNAMQMAQAKTAMENEKNQQVGLATLYQNMAPQRDETGTLKKSPYVDDMGAINWGEFLNSEKGNAWAQRYPQVAMAAMEKAGLTGGGKTPELGTEFKTFLEDKFGPMVSPQSLRQGIIWGATEEGRKSHAEWKAAKKSESEPSERKWERIKTSEYVKQGMPQEKAEAKAIEEYNKQIKPIPVIAGFEGKERVNLQNIKGLFEKPAGEYKKGESKFSDAANIEFSNALAKGQSLGEFMKSQSSSRGIMGTDGQNYLKKAYADWLAEHFKGAIKPGQVGSFLASRQNAYKANMATQRRATEFAILNNRAVAQMANMENILSKQMDAITKSGIRPIAALNAFLKNAENDPKFGAFVGALNSYLSEYMKVVSGGALSVQQITDSARTKGSEILSTSDSQKSLQAKFDVMDQEVQGVKQTWEDAVQTTYGAGAMTDITQAPPTAAPEKVVTPATTIPQDYVWK